MTAQGVADDEGGYVVPGPNDRTWLNPDHSRLVPFRWTPPTSTEPRDARWQATLAAWSEDEREDWDERPALMEFDDGSSRAEAERRAFAVIVDRGKS